MTIGQRISELRKAKGFTQEYVAEQLGVSRQAVSKWEQDVTNPDTKNLIALSELLDTTVTYLAIGKQESVERDLSRTADLLTKLSLGFMLAAFLIWVLGLLFVYSDMVTLFNLGIPFLAYGESPLAIIMVTLSALCLIAGVTLAIIAYRMLDKKKT